MADPANAASSALSFREAFGDRKPPDITRKITACVACRKLKIKCHMNDSKPPCVRCRKRGLSCTVNKSLQMILESDMSWKDNIEQRIRDLEETVAVLSDGNHAPKNVHQDDFSNREQHGTGMSEGPDQQPPQTWEVLVDADARPNAAPASYVSVVSSEPSPAQNVNVSKTDSDLIARGLISLHTAEKLFQLYQQRLDHYLYSILGEHTTLQSVRKASTTMASAICAVSALHSQSSDYQNCHREFTRYVSTQFFSRQHSLDEVRGLCIGAFWLSDMSWALVGAAVRTAIEINLHRCFVNPDLTSREWYTQARVYLLVYVCDHHFSIIYGRPPMTREFDDFNQVRALLNSQYVCEDDYRLFCQAELWSNNYRTYKTFGIDNDAPLKDSCLSDFRRLSIALDTWRADWEEKFRFNEHVANYPAKGVALHTYFAKLYLCSHAFRTFSTETPVSHATRYGVEEFTAMAINSATSILRDIVVDQEIQSHLNGLPTYFDTMIAFAVVFLLKLISNETHGRNIDREGILVLLNQISMALVNVTANMRPQHLLSGISASVKKLVEKARQPAFQTPQVSSLPANRMMGEVPFDNTSQWMLSPDDSMFIGNFDFTGSAQDLDFNFMDFSSFPQND